MKKLLIGLNFLLGGLIVLLAAVNLSPNKAAKRPAQPAAVRKNVRRQPNAAPAKEPEPLPDLDKAVEKAIAADIFSNVRSPLANIRTGRTDMTLVGMFKMGSIEGAIIRQTNVNRQFNPFLMQAMRMTGGGPGGPGGPPGGGPGGGVRWTRYTQWSAMGGRRSNAPVKQYVRVGETMANGYTLVEISRTRAVLIRGNDKLELELQDPSKSRAAARNSQPPRLNATQQFQQAQMFMQSQMLRTLQNMQRGGPQRGPAAPPANRGRR